MFVPVAACFGDPAGLLQHSPLVGELIRRNKLNLCLLQKQTAELVFLLLLFFNNLLNSGSLITPPFSFVGNCWLDCIVLQRLSI